MKQVQHSQAFFVLAGSTKPQTVVNPDCWPALFRGEPTVMLPISHKLNAEENC